MQRRVQIRRADRLSENDRVVDFDELPEGAKQTFCAIVDGVGTKTEAGTAQMLEQYEVIKYTDYYEVNNV